MKLNYSVRLFALIVIIFSCSPSYAQLETEENSFLSRLKPGAPLPEKLLSAKSIVFYSYTFSQKQLTDIQQSFQRTGIDAVGYFESDYLFAGPDVSRALAEYLNKREIVNLVFLQKNQAGFGAYIAEFNTKADLVEQNQFAWSGQERGLSELLLKIYRTAASTLKKQNLLINDMPETGLTVDPILGRRSDFFAIDLKVDPIAIPKSGDEQKDRELEEIMKVYPYKYKLTEPGLTEKELRKQGYYYVLAVIHGRGKTAKTILGYDMTKAESAIVSVTYPENQAVMKSYAADEQVFKYYIKHIDSQNVFLGTKWDADVTWQKALLNHLREFKTELRIN